MATDPREVQKLLDKLKQVQKTISEISGKPLKFEYEGMTPDQLVKDLGGAATATAKLQKELKEAQGSLRSLASGAEDFLSLTEAITAEFVALPTAFKKVQSSYKKINGFASKLSEITADIGNASLKEVKTLREKTELEFTRAKKQAENLAKELSAQRQKLSDLEDELITKDKITKADEKRLQRQESLVEEMSAALQSARDETTLVEERNTAFNNTEKTIKGINSKLGMTGAALGGLGKLVSKLGFDGAAAHLDKGKQAAKELAVALEEGSDEVNFMQKSFPKTATMLKGIQVTLGSAIKSVFTDPLAIVATLLTTALKLFNHIDHAVSNVGKTLGLARDSAHQMTMSFKASAAASGDTFLNMDRMLDAQLKISNTLGTNVRLTGEQLGNQARLAEFVGLQEEELANVYTASLLTGQSQDQLYNSVVATNDSIFSSNQLFKEAAGITGQIALNLGNNPATIAKAVAETKRLGISLENARDMAMGTLDFENSIQKELEAQVLTGKAINLNRARELAFAGDFEGAAGEMLKQVGGINEFQNMNVIAQQALAEAMGMNVDQLSDMLVARERNVRIEARALELAKGGVVTEENRLQALRENQTVSERLSNAAAKIGDFFGGMIAPAVEFVADNLERGMALFGGLFGNANKTKDELDKMQEHIATATQKGEELKSKFSGVIDFVKSIGAGLKSAFDTVKDSPVLQILGGLVGGVALFKGAKNLFQGKGLFGQKLGASASNPLYVTMAGASFASDIGSSISKTFKGKIFKGLSTVLGGKKTMAGRALRGMAAKSMGGGLAKTALRGGSKAASKSVAKVAGKSLAKTAGKSLLKKIPIVGALAGIGFGLSRAMKGDFLGAAMEVGSGLASTIPGVGTAASVGLDAALAARDIYQGTSRGVDPQPQGTQQIDAADFVIKTLPKDTLAFAGGTQFGKETNDLLRQLIAAVNSGGDVMLDGVKVGNTLSAASYKL